jgi:hypothetical protein
MDGAEKYSTSPPDHSRLSTAQPVHALAAKSLWKTHVTTSKAGRARTPETLDRNLPQDMKCLGIAVPAHSAEGCSLTAPLETSPFGQSARADAYPSDQLGAEAAPALAQPAERAARPRAYWVSATPIWKVDRTVYILRPRDGSATMTRPLEWESGI